MDQQLALGRAIAEQRRRRGLSQPELARLLDQPPSWVSQVERGLVPVDAMSLLGAVASALGMPLPLDRSGASFRPAASPAITGALRYIASGDCQRRAWPARGSHADHGISRAAGPGRPGLGPGSGPALW